MAELRAKKEHARWDFSSEGDSGGRKQRGNRSLEITPNK